MNKGQYSREQWVTISEARRKVGFDDLCLNAHVDCMYMDIYRYVNNDV